MNLTPVEDDQISLLPSTKRNLFRGGLLPRSIWKYHSPSCFHGFIPVLSLRWTQQGVRVWDGNLCVCWLSVWWTISKFNFRFPGFTLTSIGRGITVRPCSNASCPAYNRCWILLCMICHSMPHRVWRRWGAISKRRLYKSLPTCRKMIGSLLNSGGRCRSDYWSDVQIIRSWWMAWMEWMLEIPLLASWYAPKQVPLLLIQSLRHQMSSSLS